MKKIVTAALTAMLSIPFITAGAQAASRTAEINAALADTSEIHILYNDRMVKYEDVKPINNQDRIMIPFRAALENMGAEVGYDDSQRLVSATKGNISISFTLMDDTIYINNNGEQSTMTMDVPMIIVQDRTLVPIRFMSEAFGMQVGWDGDTQTVVIMDYDGYFEEMKTAAPNIARIAELRTDKFNKSSSEYGFGIYTDDSVDEVYFELSGNSENVRSGNLIKAESNIGLVTDHLTLSESPMTIMLDGDNLYVKGDVLTEIIQQVNTDDKKTFTSNKGSWYCINLEKFMKGIDIDESAVRMIKYILTSNGLPDISETIKSGMTTTGDAVFSEVLELAEQMDIIEQMDTFATVTEKENGAYSASIFIQPKDFIEILNTVLEMNMTNIDKDDALKIFSYTFAVDIENDGKTQTTGINIFMNSDTDKINSSIELWVDKTSEIYSNVGIGSIPDTSTDMTDFAIYLAKTKV